MGMGGLSRGVCGASGPCLEPCLLLAPMPGLARRLDALPRVKCWYQAQAVQPEACSSQPAARPRRRGARVAAAAADAAELPSSGLATVPGSSSTALELVGAASPELAGLGDGDAVAWLARRYGVSDRRRVRERAGRALAALQAEEPDATELSVERDILPKLEILEALSPGLGWKVFSRYPEEFGHPDAPDLWRIMAAFLYASGFSPARITALFTRHACLFAATVRDPDNLRRLFTWLADLGFSQADVVRLVDRFPLLLQTSTEGVLKPRIAFMLALGLPLPAVRAAVRRQPELLGVDSASLEQRASYLRGLGVTPLEIARLLATDPSVLLSSVDSKLEPMVGYLRAALAPCPEDLLRKLITKSSLLSRSLATVEERVEFWRGLGFSGAQLAAMLNRFPRLLVYPMAQPKYRAKLAFLGEVLRLPPTALAAFPQYVSYSLEGRIGPRAAAAARLAGRPLALAKLAASDAAFCKYYKIDPGAYAELAEGWADSEEGRRWAEAGGAEAPSCDEGDVCTDAA